MEIKKKTARSRIGQLSVFVCFLFLSDPRHPGVMTSQSARERENGWCKYMQMKHMIPLHVGSGWMHIQGLKPQTIARLKMIFGFNC